MEEKSLPGKGETVWDSLLSLGQGFGVQQQKRECMQAMLV